LVYFSASLNSLEVVIISPDDKSSSQLLPCLVHGKVKLFQVNSASQYLHELAQVVGQDQVNIICLDILTVNDNLKLNV
jgi:hypothetical protein